MLLRLLCPLSVCSECGGKMFLFVSSEIPPNMTTDQTADTFEMFRKQNKKQKKTKNKKQKTLFSTLSQQHASLVSTFPSNYTGKCQGEEEEIQEGIFFVFFTSFFLVHSIFLGYFYVTFIIFMLTSLSYVSLL